VARPDNKDYILQKTFFLLLTKGYDGVSITDIQRETGMSRGIIYHYYKDKEELFQVAAEKYLVTPFLISRESTKGFHVEEMIKYVINKYIDTARFWKDYMGAGQLTIANYDFLFYQMIRKDKVTAKKYYRMRHEEKLAWTETVKQSLSKGEIRPVLGAEKIAAHFILLLDGIWMESTENGSISRSIKLTRQTLNDYFELLKP